MSEGGLGVVIGEGRAGGLGLSLGAPGRENLDGVEERGVHRSEADGKRLVELVVTQGRRRLKQTRVAPRLVLGQTPYRCEVRGVKHRVWSSRFRRLVALTARDFT